MSPLSSVNLASSLSPRGSVGNVGPAGLTGTSSTSTGAEVKPFKDFMLDALKEVNTMQADADQAVQQLMTGGDINPAEVLTAVQKADMSFRMMMQIRNKLVSAYQEISQIRV